jgi:hypothetical protein
MAVKDLKPPTPPAPLPLKVQTLESSGKYDDLPEVRSIGMARVKGGWVALSIVSQGKDVLETEILAGPDMKLIIMEKVKLAVIRNLFSDVLRTK